MLQSISETFHYIQCTLHDILQAFLHSCAVCDILQKALRALCFIWYTHNCSTSCIACTWNTIDCPIHKPCCTWHTADCSPRCTVQNMTYHQPGTPCRFSWPFWNSYPCARKLQGHHFLCSLCQTITWKKMCDASAITVEWQQESINSLYSLFLKCQPYLS